MVSRQAGQVAEDIIAVSSRLLIPYLYARPLHQTLCAFFNSIPLPLLRSANAGVLPGFSTK